MREFEFLTESPYYRVRYQDGSHYKFVFRYNINNNEKHSVQVSCMIPENEEYDLYYRVFEVKSLNNNFKSNRYNTLPKSLPSELETLFQSLEEKIKNRDRIRRIFKK